MKTLITDIVYNLRRLCSDVWDLTPTFKITYVGDEQLFIICTESNLIFREVTSVNSSITGEDIITISLVDKSLREIYIELLQYTFLVVEIEKYRDPVFYADDLLPFAEKELKKKRSELLKTEHFYSDNVYENAFISSIKFIDEYYTLESFPDNLIFLAEWIVASGLCRRRANEAIKNEDGESIGIEGLSVSDNTGSKNQDWLELADSYDRKIDEWLYKHPQINLEFRHGVMYRSSQKNRKHIPEKYSMLPDRPVVELVSIFDRLKLQWSREFDRTFKSYRIYISDVPGMTFEKDLSLDEKEYTEVQYEAYDNWIWVKDEWLYKYVVIVTTNTRSLYRVSNEVFITDGGSSSV